MPWEFIIDEAVPIAAAPETLWAKVSDHEATPTWVRTGLQRVTLTQPGGPPPGGVGAIRSVKFVGWPAVTERVVAFDPGRTFRYKVIAGMPHLEDHLGTVSVEPTAAGCTLRWHIWFAFRWSHPMSLFAPVFIAGFRRVIRSALAEAAKQCAPAP